MIARTYEAVPGFFVQDDPHSIPESFPPRFGLLDDSADRWTKFKSHIDGLNRNAEPGASYKVFFFGRHGEGFHNVAEQKFGTKVWESHWGMLTGDGELTWGPDPDLTALGRSQAASVNNLWKTEVDAKIPLPQKMYCSPLTRALRTNVITFEGIPIDNSVKAVVVENCREENGVHTCDKRRNKTYIQTEFPQFIVEEGFKEDDELWDVAERESAMDVVRRARLVFEIIFDNDPETYISITTHSGTINAFLVVLGRSHYALPTGGVLPVVVKSTARKLKN